MKNEIYDTFKFINLILNNGNNDASLTNKSARLVVVMT